MTCLVLIAALVAGPAAGQSPGPSTHTVRAAGMPLPDGALPPGSLTVRLVQGAFAGDVRDVTVELVLDERETRSARTGAMGRAEFAHLPIGARVRASAIVNGERLQSDTFTMPADSGIRLLLVTAAGGTAAGAGGPVTHPSAPVEVLPLVSAAPPSPPDNQAAGAAIVRVVVVSLTILAFALVGAQQWRRRHW